MYFVLGSLSLVMAYVGVALPGVPGIPFILLTAFFYVRSSDKMYHWVLKHRLFGRMIREFQKHKTVPLGFKILVISQLWVSIIVAQIWFLEQMWIRILVVVSGLGVSIVAARWKETSMGVDLEATPDLPAVPTSETRSAESDPKTHSDPESLPPHKTKPASTDTP